MTIEVRCIIFSAEEVNAAAVTLLCRRDRNLDPNQIRMIEVLPTPGIEPVGRVWLHTDDRRPHLVIETADLMTALLLACRQRRIPLPVRAAKRLECTGSGVALVATIGAGAPPQTMQPPRPPDAGPTGHDAKLPPLIAATIRRLAGS